MVGFGIGALAFVVGLQLQFWVVGLLWQFGVGGGGARRCFLLRFLVYVGLARLQGNHAKSVVSGFDGFDGSMSRSIVVVNWRYF